MTDPSRIKKLIAAATAVGAVGIAGAITQIQHGSAIDCSLKAKCQRLFENASSEYQCLRKMNTEAEQKACVDPIAEGWRMTRDQCPALNVPDCAPFKPLNFPESVR